ncbi:MAG: TetR/AcrR family transcriptional regulator [Bacillota bacterium]|nr:TetR/AcrR family transcriptional regulator [Bacillota bacterium]
MFRSRAERTKDLILLAARRCFAARGFDGATMDLIAAEAGVNKALPYNYFTNKQDLYAAVTRECFLRQVESMPDERDKSPAERVRLILGALLRALCADPECAQILRWELAGGASACLTATRNGKKPILERLTEAIAEGARDGSFRPGLKVREVALHILILAQSYFICRETFEDELGIGLETFSEPAAIDRVTDYCLRVLLP